MKKRLSEEQIIAFLREADKGVPVKAQTQVARAGSSGKRADW